MAARLRAYSVSALAYLALLALAWFVARAGYFGDPVYDAALADLAATLAIFGCSVALSNSSMYDPYWSVAPPALFAYWLAGDGVSARQGIALVLVGAWALRLTFNFYRGWSDLSHEDWRYPALRRQHGRAYWIVSFFGIHFFPSVLTFLGSLALFVIATRSTPLGWLDGVGAAVTAIGVVYEAVADEQLRAFRRGAPEPGTWLRSGLWKHSRHPNYFGEVTFWWGLALLALAADPSAWWVCVGPASITALFFGISIPMIDARMVQRRPGYADYMRRVSRLVPWRVTREG